MAGLPYTEVLASHKAGRPATYTGAAKMLCRDLSSCVPYYVESDAVSPQSCTSPQCGARYDDKNRCVLNRIRPWSYGRRGHREHPGTIQSAVRTCRRIMGDFLHTNQWKRENHNFAKKKKKRGVSLSEFTRTVFGGFPRAICIRDF